MKLFLSDTLVLTLAFLELLVAFPVPDEVDTKISDNTFSLKATGIKLKPQLSKSPKQDEEEGGDYAGGLFDRLVGFGQNIFKEDISLSKVIAGASTFIPGETGNSVGSILNRIAAPFNVLIEKPLQKLILANQEPLNGTNLAIEKNNVQPTSAPVANPPAIPNNNPNLLTATTASVQPQPNLPVQSGISNEFKSPTVNNQNFVQHQIQSNENIRPVNEITGDEDDEEDNEDEDV